MFLDLNLMTPPFFSQIRAFSHRFLNCRYFKKAAMWIAISVMITNMSWASNEKETQPNHMADNDKFTQNIHGFFQLGTDHVWRGISFSNHLPEIFGSLLYVSKEGLYGGVVSYNTMLTKGGVAVVPILGMKGEKDKLSYDIAARYEDYPKYNTIVTPNIFEVYGELGYALLTFLKVTGGVGYSPNYYFKSGTGVYGNTMTFVTLPKRLMLEGGLGYQKTQKGGQPGNIWFRDYLNWAAGFARDFDNNLKLGFRYTQTNLNNVECHGFSICGTAYNLYLRKTF